jgi:hypothetical protein
MVGELQVSIIAAGGTAFVTVNPLLTKSQCKQPWSGPSRFTNSATSSSAVRLHVRQ